MRSPSGTAWKRSVVLSLAWWVPYVALMFLLDSALFGTLSARVPGRIHTFFNRNMDFFTVAFGAVVPVALPLAAAYVHRSWKILVVMVALAVVFVVAAFLLFVLVLTRPGGHLG